MRLGLARRCIAVLSAVLTFGLIGASPAAEPGRTHPVGINQVEFADAHYGPRTLSMAVFYPAAIDESSAKPFVMPFFAKLALYKDAEIAFDGEKRPLVMLSHGRGSMGSLTPGSRKPSLRTAISVPPPYHWRANNYDATNRLSRQQALAAPGRCQPRHRLPPERSRLQQIYRPQPHRGGRPAKAASLRTGSAAPRSTATNTSRSSRAGRTTSRSPRICATRCRSILSLRSR